MGKFYSRPPDLSNGGGDQEPLTPEPFYNNQNGQYVHQAHGLRIAGQGGDQSGFTSTACDITSYSHYAPTQQRFPALIPEVIPGRASRRY
jgi:hypothetical protein